MLFVTIRIVHSMVKLKDLVAYFSRVYFFTAARLGYPHGVVDLYFFRKRHSVHHMVYGVYYLFAKHIIVYSRRCKTRAVILFKLDAVKACYNNVFRHFYASFSQYAASCYRHSVVCTYYRLRKFQTAF